MPIYRAEEVPDLGECMAISRGVPVLPSGMEKEEEGVSTRTVHSETWVHFPRTLPKRKVVLLWLAQALSAIFKDLLTKWSCR